MEVKYTKSLLALPDTGTDFLGGAQSQLSQINVKEIKMKRGF